MIGMTLSVPRCSSLRAPAQPGPLCEG